MSFVCVQGRSFRRMAALQRIASGTWTNKLLNGHLVGKFCSGVLES